MSPDPQAAFLQTLDASLSDTIVRFRIGTQELSVGTLSERPTNQFCIRVHRARFFSQVLCYGIL
jgi:hypothetical protein